MLKALYNFPKFRCWVLGTKGLFLKNRKGSLVIFVGQGIGHTSQHLLKDSLHLWGEFLAKVAGQHTHHYVAQELWGGDKRHEPG